MQIATYTVVIRILNRKTVLWDRPNGRIHTVVKVAFLPYARLKEFSLYGGNYYQALLSGCPVGVASRWGERVMGYGLGLVAMCSAHTICCIETHATGRQGKAVHPCPPCRWSVRLRDAPTHIVEGVSMAMASSGSMR